MATELSDEDRAEIERIVRFWNAPAQFATLPSVEAIALHFKTDTAMLCIELCEHERVDADETEESGDYAYNQGIEDCINAIRALLRGEG